MQTKHTPDAFPVGGSKQAVFSFLQSHGFVRSDWSDKHWHRADGLHLHVYGSGSMARIHDAAGCLVSDKPIAEAVAAVKVDNA